MKKSKRLPDMSSETLRYLLAFLDADGVEEGMRKALEDAAEHRRLKALVDDAGLPRSTVENFLHGDSTMRVETAEGLLRAMGLRLEVRPR